MKELNRVIDRFIQYEENDNPAIKTLAPTSEMDGEEYLEELEKAIRHSDVFNICLSGDYSSGKSSIIESFKRKYQNYKCINISMANFVESGQGGIEEKLEKNIVKQLFYKVNHKKIPASRFTKIIDVSFIESIKYIICMIIMCIPIGILYKKKIENFFIDKIHNITQGILLVLFILISIVIIAYFYKKISNKISSIKFTKSNLEVEMKAEKNMGNAFDKYIDEIIYLFKRNNYDVIFFEDLDRFNNIEIFTKLRDLNKLINESEEVFGNKKLKRKIKFVYAIKDSIFEVADVNLKNRNNDLKINSEIVGKSRTKFFEYIIPVIPNMDFNNSYGEIQNLFKDSNNINISEELIENICIFVDDKRILINTFNEFNLYKKILKIESENDKLFSIILYKNLYPVDFLNLKQKNGILYKIFSEKEKYIQKIKGEISNEINKLKCEFNDVEEEVLKSKEEILIIIKDLLRQKNIYHVENESVDNLTVQSVKQCIKKENIQYYINGGYAGSGVASEIFRFNSTDKNFIQRINAIENKKIETQNEMRKKLRILEIKRREIYGQTISELVHNGHIDVEKIGGNDLIKILLANGYINERYEEFISYFKPGEVTNNENEFIKAVKIGSRKEIDYKLEKINKIINKIELKYFEKENLINIYLVAGILKNIREKEIDGEIIVKGKRLLEQFRQLNQFKIEFIDEFSHKMHGIYGELIKEISKENNSIFNILCIKSSRSLEFKMLTFEKVIEELEVEEILALNKEKEIEKFILELEDFLNLSIVQDNKDKIVDIIKRLELKFNKLNMPSNDVANEIFEIIYTENFYQMSIEMLTYIYNKKNESEYEVGGISYSMIKESNMKNLIEYIEGNIEEYIKKIFFYDNNNIKEKNEYLLELLNSKSLEKDTLKNIIKKKEFIIENTKDIDSLEILRGIVEKRKIVANWDNINEYFIRNNEKLDETIIKYINEDKVIADLKNIKMNDIDDENDKEKGVHIELQKKIFLEEKIANDSLIKLKDAFNDKFSNINLKNVSEERLQTLIKIDMIMLTKEIYEYIQSKQNSIELILKYIETYLKDPMIYRLKNKELTKILEILKAEEKVQLLSELELEYDEINLNYDAICRIIRKTNKLDELRREIEEICIDYIKDNIENMTVTEIRKKLAEVNEEYEGFLKTKGNFSIEITENINEDFLELLYNKKVIGRYRSENDKVRIYRLTN